jgi:hypothetical protein
VHTDGIAETVRHRINHIRGAAPSLWPSGPAPQSFESERPADPRPKRRLLYAALCAFAIAVIVFVLLKSNLDWLAADVRTNFM